jgi:hypothetical protein
VRHCPPLRAHSIQGVNLPRHWKAKKCLLKGGNSAHVHPVATETVSDEYVFKVPALNITLTEPYIIPTPARPGT